MSNTIETSFSSFFDKSKLLYNLLEDDLSKEIYSQRFLFSATECQNSLDKLVSLSSDNVRNKIQEYRKTAAISKQIILYGAGSIGITMLHILKEFKDKILFCDRNYKMIKNIEGVAVISPEELFSEYKNSVVFISAIPGYQEIYSSLVNNGISKENIINAVYDDLNEIYFDSIVSLADNEIFADIGGYKGETSIEFTKKMVTQNKKYKKIYIFEPDKLNYQALKTNIKELKIEKTKCYNIGIWNEKSELSFDEGLDIGSCITDSGKTTIQVDSLDNLFENSQISDYPTFIKMDIEGAELAALKGAKRIITTTTPKIAISIYHKPEDITELIAYLHNLSAKYKFYLRHYTTWKDETVLYAINI